MRPFLPTVFALIVAGCSNPAPVDRTASTPSLANYFDNTGRDDVLTGGVRMIPITTPKGTFKRVDQARRQQPAASRCCCSTAARRDARVLRGVRQLLPGRGHRVLLLRSARLALQRPARRRRRCGSCRASSTRSSRCARRSGSIKDNFYLLGHSWGGILAIEYALEHQRAPQGPGHLEHDVEHPGVQRVRARRADAGDGSRRCSPRSRSSRRRGSTTSPRYMELLMPHHYAQHILRMPPEQWPEPVNRAFKHLNPTIYVPMQGPSELGAQRQAGELGPHGRPRQDHRADAGHRREARHDGSEAHGVDGDAVPEGRASSTARTAATWRCTTISRRISRA